MGALSFPSFPRPGGLGGAVAELIPTAPLLVRRARIADASSQKWWLQEGWGWPGRRVAWARRAKVWVISSAQACSWERIKPSNSCSDEMGKWGR